MRVLTERDENILLMLKKMDYLTVAQICKLFDVRAKNAYRIMRNLEPYIQSFKHERKDVYYLSREGREVVQCHKVRKRLSTAEHYIMRNDLYIYLNQPATWKNEVELIYTYNRKDPESKKIIAIPDAYFKAFTLNGEREHIIEIDYTQRMHKNKAKIEKYRKLIEKGVFENAPKFIWVTTTPHRQRTIKELCEGLDTTIYLRSDLR